ncbi:MAG: glycosyltransferase family 1 protein [Patescibacteria group bacterium]
MAKIGIDFRSACTSRKTGKGWYTYRMVKVLLEVDLQNEYRLYVNRGDLPEDFAIPDGAVAKICVINSNPLLWHFRVIADLKKECIKTFWAPSSFIIPAFLPNTINSIITIHDLVAFLFPKTHQFKATVMEKLFLKKALNKTSKAVCVSENTRRDLVRLFDFPKEKTSVIPLAPAIVENSGEAESTEMTKRLPHIATGNYILAVGTVEPRKNFGTAIAAFRKLRTQHHDLSLLIVGGKGWKEHIGEEDGVALLGYIAEPELFALYKNARALVFPSLYEGFGLPPLEAMALGCPVVCSDTSSLPEVVGDAAIMCDPMNVDAIFNALSKILTDDALRHELIAKGHAQAAKFSWKKSAEELRDIINAVAL